MIDAPAIKALEKAGVAVVVPSDGAAYDALRPNFNKRLDGHPALIALPHDARAAATALRGCVEHLIPFHIRSGGHCYEGWSLPSGGRALIDMRELRDVDLRVTADGRWQAVVGAGARRADVLAVLQ